VFVWVFGLTKGQTNPYNKAVPSFHDCTVYSSRKKGGYGGTAACGCRCPQLTKTVRICRLTWASEKGLGRAKWKCT
jgi:hypothetical protein